MSDFYNLEQREILRAERLAAAAAAHRERRERIATAALAGLLANTQWLPNDTTYEQISNYAVRAADALIAELDKEVKP